MLATVPRKALVYLGSMLFGLAVTACGGGTAEPTPTGPSPYVVAISPIVSSIGTSFEIVESQFAAAETALHESDYVVTGTGGTGAGPEGLMQVFTDGVATFSQQGTTLESLEKQLAQISPPKDARRYHELLTKYVVEMEEAVREAERQFERPDILCCVSMAFDSWDSRSTQADELKDEINAEARRFEYPEVD